MPVFLSRMVFEASAECHVFPSRLVFEASSWGVPVVPSRLVFDAFASPDAEHYLSMRFPNLFFMS